MNFVEILKLLWIFEVLAKKICINYKIYSKFLNCFIVCVNHNEQQNGGWRLSISLKLEIFITPVVDAKLVIAMNHLIFRIFQKF
jgi:hypothetical protein